MVPTEHNATSSKILVWQTELIIVHLLPLLSAEHSVQQSGDRLLIPTALDTLSPQQSAVFLFGCQVMRLLENCPLFPSVLLLPAKSIPIPSNLPNNALLANCSKDFYFDTINQILYLSESRLQHVGHFIATLLLSMAYIASGNQADSDRWGQIFVSWWGIE